MMRGGPEESSRVSADAKNRNEKNHQPGKGKTMSTLIATPSPNHVPAPLTGKDKKVLDAFYTKYGVMGGEDSDKNEALKKVIQARSFFALGGNETMAMELRANERIYLLKYA